MKDFLRYIRLWSVSDLYTLKKKKKKKKERLFLNPGITSAEMFPNADVNQYIAEIHKVRKHAAIAFKCWLVQDPRSKFLVNPTRSWP